MNMMDLATMLFGRSRAEENIVSTDATTRTYIGTATSDSSDGSVYVALSEDVTMPDDYDGEHGVGVEMPTTVGVSEGDEVVVTVFGGGTLKAPVVTGNPGWGDAVQEQAANAETIAEQAEAVANATGQHFWPDTDGVHVTEVTQDEWNDSTGTSYHSGANVLLNALGQLFRDGLSNILAILSGTDPGVAIYDGEGNAVDNILALLTKSLIRLGGRFAASGRSTAKVQFFEDDSALTDLTAEHYIDTTTEPQVSHGLALSSTITDEELPDGTSRTVTGNVEVWEQIYNDGSTYSDEVTASLNGATTNRQNNVSMGVQAIESSGASSQRIAFIVADVLRLTHGTGSSASLESYAVSDVKTAIDRSLVQGTVYAATSNASVLGTGVDNYTDGATVTLPAGSYVIIGAWEFNTASTSGTRNNAVALWQGSTYLTQTRIFNATQNYSSLQVSAAITLTAQTSVKVRGASSRPSSAAPTRIYAIRIR